MVSCPEFHTPINGYAIRCKKFISEGVSRSAWAGSLLELPTHDPTRRRLNYGRTTWTLAQLVPASLLASTMQMSLPLPPLAVSRLSPSATLILSRPVPPLTSSRSAVYLLANTRSLPPLRTMSSLRPSPWRSRTLSLSPEATQGSTLVHWTSAPSASAAAAARGTSTATRATITISLRILLSFRQRGLPPTGADPRRFAWTGNTLKEARSGRIPQMD